MLAKLSYNKQITKSSSQQDALEVYIMLSIHYWKDLYLELSELAVELQSGKEHRDRAIAKGTQRQNRGNQ